MRQCVVVWGSPYDTAAMAAVPDFLCGFASCRAARGALPRAFYQNIIAQIFFEKNSIKSG